MKLAALTIACLLPLVNATAADVDLIINNFDCSAPTAIGYLPGTTVTSDCELLASTDGTEPPASIPANIVLVSYEIHYVWFLPIPFPMETRTVHALTLSGPDYDALPTIDLTHDLDGAPLSTWLADQLSQVRILRLRAVLDPAGVVDESIAGGEGNNVVTEPLLTAFTLAPVKTAALVGKAHLELGSAEIVKGSVGACGGLRVFILTGDATWIPSTNGDWSTTPFVVGGRCADIAHIDSDGLTLSLLGTFGFSQVTGTLGGLPVVVSGKFSDHGFKFSSGALELPKYHSYHAPNRAGLPVPAGQRTVKFKNLRLGRNTGDFKTLRGLIGAGWLHARALPFYLSVTGIVATTGQVGGVYDGARYIGDRFFRLGDPRFPILGIPRVATNDIRYANPKLAPSVGNFRVRPNGLHAQVDFFQGAGTAHFPESLIAWKAFSVVVQAGGLKDQQRLPSDVAIFIDQSSACPECPVDVGANTSFTLTPTVDNGVGFDGAVMSRVDGLNEPSWGPWNDSTGHIFERTGDANHGGVTLFPGFEALDTSGPLNVPDYLLGHREAIAVAGEDTLLPGDHHTRASAETRAGNHFGPGLTVGPELYSDGGVPTAGLGEFLDDTTTAIRFGGSGAPQTVINANIGTKYILRRGGITGAFNTGMPPTLDVYGYQLPLTRFGWRQVNNGVDPYTWMDGEVSIPTPGEFTAVFDSLGFGCPGHLAQAVVAQCPAEGVGPNCAESLGAWRTAIDLLTLGFPLPPGLEACDAGDRTLEVGMDVALKALDERLGLTSGWTPAGEPTDSRITGATDHVMDRPTAPDAGQDEGFGVALGSPINLEYSGDNTDGWFVAAAGMAVPLWDSLIVELRLRNETLDAASATVVAAPGAIADWENADPHGGHAVPAHYAWGDTAFHFDLDVFYDTPANSTAMPRFTGLTREHDLAILSLSAVAERVTPKQTNILFGASAELSQLEFAEVDLSIDLDDPESLTKVDDFFATIGINSAPITSILGDVASAMDALDNYAPREAIIADLVRDLFSTHLSQLTDSAGLTAGLDTIAEGLNTIRSLPAQFASEASIVLTELLADVLSPIGAAMDTLAIDAMSDASQLASGAVTCGLDPGQLPCLQVLEALGQVRGALAQVRVALGVLTASAGQAGGALTGTLAWAKNVVADVDVLVSDVLTIVQNQSELVDALTSGDASVNDIIELLLEEFSPVIGALISSMENVPLLANLQELAALALLPPETDDIESDIQQDAELLAGDLATADTNFEAQAGGMSGALDGVISALIAIQNTLSQIDQELTALESELSVPIDTAVNALELGKDVVEGVDGLVAFLEDEVRCAQDILCIPSWTGLSDAEVEDSLFTMAEDLTGGQLSFVSVVGGDTEGVLLQLGDLLRGPVDEALARVSAAVESAIPGVQDLPLITNADELLDYLVDLFMANPAVEKLLATFQEQYDRIIADTIGLAGTLSDAVEATLNDVAQSLEDQANAVLDQANAVIKDILPIEAARLDGEAIILGDELDRTHVSASWTMRGDDPDTTSTFDAAFELTPWSTNGKGDACNSDDAAATIDATITAQDIPLRILSQDIVIDTLDIGFTLDGSGDSITVKAVFGGITSDDGFSFESFDLYDLGLFVGGGVEEQYLGARASATLGSVQMGVAALFGKTCNLEVLESLDPQVADFITLPGGVFNGIYVRGSASIPVVDFGCLLTLSLGADAGSWLLIGPPLTIGGLIGGSGSGRLGCIGALHGGLTVLGEKSGPTLKLAGQGFGVAGIGTGCEPETWTSVIKSREDDWCGTGDAVLDATFEDGIWTVGQPIVSAPH